MSSTGVVTPAAQPWDVEAIVKDALAILRLPASDPDANRVRDAVLNATTLIDSLLDGATPLTTIPGPVNYAATLAAIELYRRKDAPFGVLNAWSVDEISVRIPADVMRGIRSLVIRSKQRWGVA